ncbi:MAG: response regulator [Fuerstiella sp.]
MDNISEHRYRNRLNQLMLQAMTLDCNAESDVDRLRQLERLEAVSLTVQQLTEDFKVQLDPDWLESRVRILVVEDDACQRNAVVAGLRTAGLFVAEATDGADAVNYLHRAMSPDVILMDIEMPFCDGIEATTLINHIPMGGRVKMIAVTAKKPEELNLSSFDGYIQKPFQLSQLIGKIREVVEDIDESADELEKRAFAK